MSGESGERRWDGGRARELTGVVLWALAAAAWGTAMVVPWFRAGLLAHPSPMDAAGLLRTGVLDVPPAAGFAVLVLPGLALVLLGIAPLRGPGVQAVRVALWLVSSGIGLALVVVLSTISARTFGWGAGLVVVGCLLGLAALCCASVRTGPLSPDPAP